MSSETSTKPPRLPALRSSEGKPDAADAGLQPWQFFVLAALGCATAVTFISRGQGPAAIILLSVLMAAAALVGYAALRAVRPLVSPEQDRTVMVGQRTRVALEREKMLALRSIKELEFDRAMGRLSDDDWREMSGRLRARAARLIRQLDAGSGYRVQIEGELTKRLGAADARLTPSRSDGVDADARRGTIGDAEARSAAMGDADADAGSATAEARSAKALAERVCASCETSNDADARFCKGCGARL
jgi:hypothetical protein